MTEHERRQKRHQRQRRRRRRKKTLIAGIAVCAVLAIGVGGVVWNQQKQQRSLQITAGNSHDVGSKYRDIEYNGVKYRYNNRVTAILYTGVDSTGKLEGTAQYGNKARADSIQLVVMNELTDKITVLSINRDTMTQIRRYTMQGTDEGLYTTHLGYAYTYGDGGEVSCKSLCEAVSLLMGGVPIKEYIVTNIDSLSYINGLIDGVTLTVPNSDLESVSDKFYEGAEVTIEDDEAEEYLRYRDTDIAFSNEGRMERQKSYVTAYLAKIRGMNTKDLEKMWNKLDDMGDHLQTSITKNKYLSLIKKVKSMELTEESYEQLAGTDQEGELHDEFYPDVQALQEKIIELFYIQE